MKLKDLKIGQKFLFIDNERLTDVYVKKREFINKDYCIVGLPGVDSFAVRIDTDVMEQPDEDLDFETELKSFFNSDDYLNSPGDGYLLVARHFYELGKNSK